MAELRARGLERVTGDLVLDRSHFNLPEHDPAAFDQEPLRPYNVGPDALLVNFKSFRFQFAPDAPRGAVAVRADPPLPELRLDALPQLANGDCGDWRALLGATWVDQTASASAAFAGRYPRSCGERDWYVALLDHPAYVHGMFATYFRRGRRAVRRRPARRSRAEERRAVRGDGVGAALRHRPRRQQAVEQRDGAPDLPDARDDAPSAARDAGAGGRRRAALAQGQEARDAGARARERLGPVAPRARERQRTRAAARLGRRQPGARGIRELARRRGARRHRCSGGFATAPSAGRRCSRPARSKACARWPAT